MIKNIKERIVGISGSASGIISILGSWQICHNVCLGVVAVLGIIGITVAGMPLLFLTKVTVPFWTAAFLLFLITIVLYFKKKCISKNMIMFNTGLIIAGIPFQSLQKFSIIFWVIGGVLSGSAIVIFAKNELSGGEINENKL